jgi:hypothetical protein
MDVVDVIRKRIDQALASEHSIPNCDVRLLLLEIERLKKLLARLIWSDHKMIYPMNH